MFICKIERGPTEVEAKKSETWIRGTRIFEYTSVAISHEKEQTEFTFFIKDDVVETAILGKNQLYNNGHIFLMNNEGKTIDHYRAIGLIKVK